MRESFEAWHQIEYPGATLSRRANGEYFNLYVDMCWTGWKSSRAAIEVELPALENSSSYHDGADQRDEKVMECRKSIESLGLRVKP